MNPAFSVIFFTTLSGAGYGLIAWLGMYYASRPMPWHRQDALIPLAVGLALVTIGLSSSTFHLGKPMRAWRAFSQWRTSWLSREGVVSLATYVPAVCFGWLVWHGESSIFSHVVGITLAACSLATVACTAMIYASLKPIPAWTQRWVVPGYLLFAALTGWLLFAAMTSTMPVRGLIGASILATVLAAVKIAYWRVIDGLAMPSREAATALEGIGKVTVFERPHTEENYLTREMGFVLARKHSRKLRLVAVVLFAAIPMLALFVAYLFPPAGSLALWFAAVGALLGAFVERWLFFAEAKHMVMLYY